MGLTTKEISQVLKFKDKTPCFLFDRAKFDSVSKSLNDAFSKLPIKLAYSVKTNNADCVLKAAIKGEFSYLEVCSKDEVKKAIKAGARYSQIIYNGVLSELDYRFKVASHGGIVNVDSYEMYKALSEYAKKKHKKIKIGARINLDIGSGYSRFGLTAYEIENFLIDLRNDEYLSLAGFIFHRYGGRDLSGWKKKLSAISDFLDRFSAEELCRIEYLDFGSNFYGDMDERLAAQFENVPMFNEYADLILNILQKHFENNPTVMLEPGTPVVANSVSLLAKIDSVKKDVAIVDASIFDIGFICWSKKVPFDLLMCAPRIQPIKEIHGYACTENDIIEKGIDVQTGVGDLVLFRNCGAYSYSQDSDFIKNKLKVYAI